MRTLTFYVLILLVMPLGKAFGQVAGFNGIGFSTYPGFLIAHRDDVKNMESHIIGFELSFYKKNIRETWASSYRKPQLGLSLMFMDLGKPQLTGNVFAILPSFSRYVTSIGYTDVRFKAGSGIGYLTKKFDPYTNRRNQSIGSNLNAAMQLFVILQRAKPNDAVGFNLGLGITHFSNGSFRVPNLGVNMPSLYLGLESLTSSSVGMGKDSVQHKTWKFFAAYAFKERNLTKPQGFHIFNFEAVKMYQRSSVKDWRVGADIFLDKTHHYLDYPGTSLKNLKPQEITELGVFGGHQWTISRIQFKLDIGFYAYKPSHNKFFTYQRLGFDYLINDKLFATWNLKTHFGIADHFTFGLGFRL